jgi:hypothetical protein
MRRWRRAYRIKLFSDRGFYATVLAIKVALFAFAIVVGLIFIFAEKKSHDPPYQPKLPQFGTMFD